MWYNTNVANYANEGDESMKKSKTNIDINRSNVEVELRRLSQIPIEELYVEYNTSKDGINPVDVEDIFDEFGKNIITLR